MGWNEQVFRRYCERGQDPAFWAEPFNALSNAGFIIAAILMIARIHRENAAIPSSDRLVLWALAALTAIIGVGSFLFHTFATRWAMFADVVPIMLFMTVYLCVVLRLFLEMSWRGMAALAAGFVAATLVASSLACSNGAVSIVTAAREPCLKGTVGYVPALAALVLVGALLRRNPVLARRLLTAAGIFLAAMTLRWLDRDVCAATQLLGKVRGTHALWHLLNAATIWLLLQAVLDVAKARHRGRVL